MDKNNSMQSEGRSTYSSSAGALNKKVGDGLERAGERISGAGFGAIGESIHKAGDKLEHITESKLFEQAGQWMGDVTDKAKELDKSVREFVRERPLTVFLGAVVVGFVATKLLTSSTKKAA